MSSLAEANLQKIRDTMTTAAATNPSQEMGMQGEIDAAKAELAKGNEEAALALTG